MAIRTIFVTAEECARGERQGWLEFVRDYAPIARRLLDHYFPDLRPELDSHIAGVFHRARADENAWFCQLHFANDREFFMAFRDLVLGYARSAANATSLAVSLDDARELMRDLTVVQRELFWTVLKGYDVPQAASILMNADSTTANVAEIARQRLNEFAPARPNENGLSRALVKLAEKSATPECLSLKTLNNIINGQVSWQDRDRAEMHIRDCMHCLDRFTALQEMIWYHRQAEPLSEAEAERIVDSLGLPRKRAGIVNRLFKRTA